MSEPFDTNLKERRSMRAPSAASMLLPELRGRHVAWAGVESAEPLLRGCDQRELLERLAAGGIRHLVVPLNGSAEDSCIFARRHVEIPGKPAEILYDLERRDEGAFTRLKFLLETAASSGVMIGLSLFDVAPGAAGPFSAGANLQGLGLADVDGRHAERLRAILNHATDWVCSAARGFQGVWIEVFRNARGEPGAAERALCTRVAETFSRYREDLSPMRLGPWVALRRAEMLAEKHVAQAAPFDASRTVAGGADVEFSQALLNAEAAAGACGAELLFSRAPVRQPALLRMTESAVCAQYERLWRALFQGYWPVVSMRVNKSRDPHLWDSIGALARFGVAWAGRGALRPATELLAPMRSSLAFAAEDGSGRLFAYFGEPMFDGLTLSLPPGFYRYYWISPSAARVVDRGEGAEGGPRAHIPGCGDPDAKLLVIEENEAPDSLAVW